LPGESTPGGDQTITSDLQFVHKVDILSAL
jgi:hypothetical protein